MSGKSAKKSKTDDPKDNVFMVEKVLDKRAGKAGRDEFLIQWQGFPETETSWEPRENLQCVDMLDEFEKEYVQREKLSHRRDKSPEQDQGSSADEEPPSNDKYLLNGKQLKCIVGLTRGPGELHFLCKFTDDTARLLPAKEVNHRYRPFVDEYGNFLRRQMDKRQKRTGEGKKRNIGIDEDDDEWPKLPPGFDNFTPSKQTKRDKPRFSETPTASDLLNDIHMETSGNLLSSFPQDPIEETNDKVEIQDSLLSVFDDSSNSPPPCAILIDTVPNDDDLLFPGIP